ncbi:hypothetical protein ANO14919_092210 [Xylariales sp. No.14919]|nr:hypothetical protein ANO14919_092210 [Xylariales sp. No.14919]
MVRSRELFVVSIGGSMKLYNTMDQRVHLTLGTGYLTYQMVRSSVSGKDLGGGLRLSFTGIRAPLRSAGTCTLEIRTT